MSWAAKTVLRAPVSATAPPTRGHGQRPFVQDFSRRSYHTRLAMAEKLDMELDELVERGRGGKAPRGGGRGVRRGGREAKGPAEAPEAPYRNTGGRRHLEGASLKDIALAPERDRCVPRKSQQVCEPMATDSRDWFGLQGREGVLDDRGQDHSGESFFRLSAACLASPQLN